MEQKSPEELRELVAEAARNLLTHNYPLDDETRKAIKITIGDMVVGIVDSLGYSAAIPAVGVYELKPAEFNYLITSPISFTLEGSTKELDLKTSGHR